MVGFSDQNGTQFTASTQEIEDRDQNSSMRRITCHKLTKKGTVLATGTSNSKVSHAHQRDAPFVVKELTMGLEVSGIAKTPDQIKEVTEKPDGKLTRAAIAAGKDRTAPESVVKQEENVAA